MISINKQIYTRPLETPRGLRRGQKMQIELFLPPTDIPEYIYQEIESEKDELNIRFKYVDKEEEKELWANSDVRLIIGTYSGKLLRIEIKGVKENHITEVQLTHKIRTEVRNAITHSVNRLSGLRFRSNLERAEQTLQQNADKLGELAIAG